jgi:hypothetical protein
VYCTAICGEDGKDVCTYIHSKVMVVDDRFLTLGSANTTNRSMGLDSELNLSWEAERPGDATEHAIRRVRVSLMTEHTGLKRLSELRQLARVRGLVPYLDGVATAKSHRLRLHPLETVFDQRPLLKPLEPEEFSIDPEDSVLSEGLFESMKKDGLFASSIRRLHQLLVGEPRRPLRAALPVSSDASSVDA